MCVVSFGCVDEALLLTFSQSSVLGFSILRGSGRLPRRGNSKICPLSGQMENRLVSQFIRGLTTSSHIWPSITLQPTMFAKRKGMVGLIAENHSESRTSV